MRIRPAAEDDAPAIAGIWNGVIAGSTATFTTDPKCAGDLAAAIRAAGGAYRVALLEGRIAGFACHGPFRPGPGYVRTREHSVHVASAARGRGLGRMLMADLEAHAARAGVRVLVAAISGENAGAAAFHRALGFAEVGRMPQVGHKYGRFLDLVLMQKILSPH